MDIEHLEETHLLLNSVTHIIMCDVSHNWRHYDARYSCEGIGDAHEGTGEWRGDVDVVGKKSWVHPAQEHRAKRE